MLVFDSLYLETIDLLTTVSSLVIQLPNEFIAEAVTKLCDLYEDFSDGKNRKHFAKLYSYRHFPLVNHLG